MAKKKLGALEIPPHHTTLSDWKGKDPDFAAEVEFADRKYVERLEAECDRRAVEGVRRLKFNKAGFPFTDPDTGEAYEERHYSDNLLMFRLKAKAPEKYRERHEVKMSDAKLNAEIQRLLDKR